MKKICAFMIAAILLLSVCGCTGPTKKEENILRVGIECAYAPYNWETAEKNEYTAEIENHDGFYGGRGISSYKTRKSTEVFNAL